MARAGIFIGVDQTGNLDKLSDAAAGAERMHNWAIAQGMADIKQARLFTDAGGNKVDPNDIYNAIKQIIDGPGVDQLIVYFAGHGVNINRGERWLLSEAPVKPSAAVNLKGSVELAQYSGIKHVVFFSDACRVAPDSIQASNVSGIEIFPNDAVADLTNPVDQFFACGLGRTAAEVKDAASAASNFSALYTEALLSALSDGALDALKPEPPSDPDWRYVGTATLRDYLAKEVPRRIIAKKLVGKVNQNPDAIVIASDHWVSRVPRVAFRGIQMPSPPVEPAPQDNRNILANALIASGDPSNDPAHGMSLPMSLKKGVAEAVEAVAPIFGPDHFESGCGIKVRGARIMDVFATRGASVELLGDELVRVSLDRAPCMSILLRFDNYTCAVVPAIHGYLAALTVKDGELADVTYEPSTTHYRWAGYQNKLDELRRLRAVIATATQDGWFHLDEANALTLARQMQFEKSIDPTLSIYAAYAYHDLQRRDIIGDMAGFLRSDIGAVLFDLMLLGRKLVDKTLLPQDHIVPFFPLLSQGWALLKANRVKKHPVLDKIEPLMKDSLWTLFDSSAFDLLKETMSQGDVS